MCCGSMSDISHEQHVEHEYISKVIASNWRVLRKRRGAENIMELLAMSCDGKRELINV